MDLQTFFTQNSECALAFSGGADSSFLLWAACRYARRVKAYFIKTAFQPAFELDDARRLASQLNAALEVIETDILAESSVADNPHNRCYFCKKKLFTLLARRARTDGFTTVLDGTNASDDESDRPGMKALEELEVRSPLRECGITKDELRRLSKDAGLFTWNKCAYACLATRIPAGTPITANLLNKVEQGEKALFDMGFTDFRVRVFAAAARLELTAGQMQKALQNREQIINALKPHFTAVLLDLAQRKPSAPQPEDV